jgi:hypothetical protein
MKDNKKGRFELCFYEGYRNRETPRSVIIGDREFLIEQIFWRKRVQDEKSGKTVEVFKCKMDGQTVRISVEDSGKFEITFL